MVIFFVIVNGQKYSGQFHFQSIDLFNLDVFQIMRMIFYLFLFFSIILKLSIGNDEFDRLPTPLAEHRYFVYCNKDYKLLGSCTNIPRANMPHKILSDPNKIRRNPWYRNPIGSCGTSENVGILQIR